MRTRCRLGAVALLLISISIFCWYYSFLDNLNMWLTGNILWLAFGYVNTIKVPLVNIMVNAFANRLKEQRKRFECTQEVFGKLGGVGRTTQLKYERGERQPDVVYLEGLATAGVDIKYLITGEYDKALAEKEEGHKKPLTPADAFNVAAEIVNELSLDEYATTDMLTDLVQCIYTSGIEKPHVKELLRIALIPMTARRKK